MSETRLKRPTFLHGLSFRLLVLTMFFVMLAEFLIWTPSIARNRKVYLEENIAQAGMTLLGRVVESDGHKLTIAPDLKEKVAQAD